MSRMLDEVREEAEQKEVTEEMTKKRKILISVAVVLVAAIVVLAVIISRAEWIQTDKDQYLLGEEVTIHLTNPTFRTLERGYSGIEGVYGVTRLLIILPIRPGQTYTWTWDQTQFVFPDDSRNFTQVPPGTYTAWWMPYDLSVASWVRYYLKTNEPVGRFTYEFEIVEGTAEGQH